MSVTPTSALFLEAAARIGHDVVADAVWHEQRCAWVGAAPEEALGGSVSMTYATLGPDLYGGTAGVGLVLAELNRATGDAVFESTALGALEHALMHADAIEPALKLGLYTGALGVAVAAARVAVVLDRADLRERAAALARSVDPAVEGAENDLMGGRAGAVIAYLALADLLDGEPLLDLAARSGDALVAAAVERDGALLWTSPALPTQEPLTGFSHGAAGIGLALLELADATGEARYHDAAVRAFAYERGLYDPRARNWPDLREIARRGQPPGAPPSFASLWCHGAPGIALSRIRAYELTGDEDYRNEATIALETTLAAVQAELHTGNYSLCHGLAGNAEVLVEGRDLLGEEADRLAAAVATEGVHSYLSRGAPWPSGAFGGKTASLFLGLAGTAYFYLRLHEPSVPSVLLLRTRRVGNR